MTLLIGYRGEHLSIVMSDDRITYHGNQDYFIDGHNKLINLPDMGWSVASGLTEFIDEYKYKLAKSEIRNVGDIIESFSSSVKAATRENPLYKKDIENSEILSTWFGTEADINALAFHVGLLNKRHITENGIAVLQKNNLYIGFPYGFSQQKIEKYNEKYSTFKDELNLSSVLKYLLEAFHNISSETEYASSHCDIGIHMMDTDGIYKIKISGDSKELLLCDDITQRYEVVDVIKGDNRYH